MADEIKIVIYGAAGAGKSTIARLVRNVLQRAFPGRVTLVGDDDVDAAYHKQRQLRFRDAKETMIELSMVTLAQPPRSGLNQ